MSSFEKFIESDAFFPVLILLLVMLIGVFIWVIVSNNNATKKARQRKNNLNIDESAEIKMVADPTRPSEPVRIKKEVETGGSEIRIVASSQATAEEHKNEVVYDTSSSPIDEDFEEPLAPDANSTEPIVEAIDEEKEFEVPDISEVESDIPQLVVETPTIEKDLEVIEQNDVDSKEDEEEEEIELPIPKIMTQEDATQAIDEASKVIEELKNIDIDKELENSIFNSKPTDDHSINENIKVEEPHEYVGEKTEIFDFDFDEVAKAANEVNVEDEIIKAANKYIEEIMKKNEN